MLGRLAKLTAAMNTPERFSKGRELRRRRVRVDPEGEGSHAGTGRCAGRTGASSYTFRSLQVEQRPPGHNHHGKIARPTEPTAIGPACSPGGLLVNKGAGEDGRRDGRAEGNLLIERARRFGARRQQMLPRCARVQTMTRANAASIGVYRGLYLCRLGKKEQ